jgi:hypothetical protein
MYLYFTKKIYKDAIVYYWDKYLSNEYLVYETETGLRAFIIYLSDNIEFELEIIMAYMDHKFGIEKPMPYPEFEGGD